MKIVVTVHHFPPRFTAGAELYTRRFVQWLRRRGHSVQVICVESITTETRGVEWRRDDHDGIPVIRLFINLAGTPDPFRYSFDNPAIGEWFATFLRDERPDVLHSQSCYLLSASTLTAAREQSVPVILTLHDFWFLCPRITLLKPIGSVCGVPDDPAECAWCVATERRRFRLPETLSRGVAGRLVQSLLWSPTLARYAGIFPDAPAVAERRQQLLRTLEHVDMIVSPTQYLFNLLTRAGVTPARIVVSRQGVDPDEWLPPAHQKTPSAEEMRFSYIGQLTPHKGIHVLISAFKRLRADVRAARLRIYGDPNAFPAYVRQLQDMARGHPSIEFAGHFENRRLAQILADADALVVPSLGLENPSLTIMEALAAGTPVVASRVGPVPEIVHHDVNGLLVEPGDVEALTARLQRLCDEPAVVARLTAHTRPVRLLDDEMQETMGFYERLLKCV